MKSILSFLAGFVVLVSAVTTQAAIVSVDFGEEGFSPEISYSEYSNDSGYSTWSYSAAYSLELPTNSTSTPTLRYSHYRSDYANGSHFENTQIRLYNLDAMGEQDTGQYVAYKLGEGVAVDGNASYTISTLLYDWRATNYNGRWEDMQEGESAYLGFTFTNAEDVDCYGWMELYIDSWDGYVTIFGYAYDDTGAAILTGDTGSPVPLPSAVWLLGSGLLALSGMRRRN